MADLAEAWKRALPEIKEAVTGVGVWTALNTTRPVALEDGSLVLGLPHGDNELAGHLKVMSTKRLIETFMGRVLGMPLTLRIIDGIAQEDWEAQKRRDSESKRLQEQALNKMRAEMTAKSSWEGIYDQIGRKYAAVSQKSLPQNRARFYEEVIELVAQTRRSQEHWDELGERNFARCLERVAQYAEVPATLVATHVLQRAGEL
jgi:hypothetical protein